MSDKKNKKPKDRRNAGFTKAGRNSRSGGKNQGGARKGRRMATHGTVDLFTARRQDRRKETIEATQQEQLRFREEQAALALRNLEDRLDPQSLAFEHATLTIELFPSVELKGMKRTRAAAELSESRLARRPATPELTRRDLAIGKSVAVQLLNEAYLELVPSARQAQLV